MDPNRPLGPGYPVTLLLEGRSCLVVGGGPVAERKAAGLVAAGARVTVVAPSVAAGLAAMDVELLRRPFEASDVAGRRLVVSATGRPEVERAVRDAAEAAGVLVNAADDPEACSVLLPAIVRRGPVTVAVSTTGRSPALASVLRDLVAEVVGPEVAEVAGALAAARRRLHADHRSTEGLPFGDLARQLLSAAAGGGRRDSLDRLVADWLAELPLPS